MQNQSDSPFAVRQPGGYTLSSWLLLRLVPFDFLRPIFSLMPLTVSFAAVFRLLEFVVRAEKLLLRCPPYVVFHRTVSVVGQLCLVNSFPGCYVWVAGPQRLSDSFFLRQTVLLRFLIRLDEHCSYLSMGSSSPSSN